ncbi:MAG: lipid-A-disaccharide synthase N-terminal domain-containing protein [Chlamydiota bacterium]
MSPELRNLLYPLGYLASLFFSLRFFIQWILSERAGRSYVTALFWQISLVGNILLMLQGTIQLQAHLAFIQAINVVISWRNLNLMKTHGKPAKFSKVLISLVLILVMVGTAFVLQGIFSDEGLRWFVIPKTSYQYYRPKDVAIIWHVLGTLSMMLFASRFWIQWWQAEKTKVSTLGKSFWYLSLLGAFFSTIYFVYLCDYVNIIGYSLGMIPYLRNLMLLKKRSAYE